jgi:hypothetical protein
LLSVSLGGDAGIGKHRRPETADTHESTWTGHLTIGQHCFFWSSADYGDAHLLDTGSCATLEDAMAILKTRMNHLFEALLGSSAEPEAASEHHCISRLRDQRLIDDAVRRGRLADNQRQLRYHASPPAVRSGVD